MAELVAYPARFDFGRLFADTGRVFARAGLPILVGVLVLGVAPDFASSVGWWRRPPGITDDLYQRTALTIVLAKVAIKLAAYAAVAAFVAVTSLPVLAGGSWRDMATPARVASGFVSALCVSALGNWVSLASPIILQFFPVRETTVILALAGLLSLTVSRAYLGIAVYAAVAEQSDPGSAFARSSRLLYRLRWRAVGLWLLYFVVVGLVQYGSSLALFSAGIPFTAPGLGFAVVTASRLFVGALFDIVFSSVFLQARRIADGPSAGELQDVFA